MSEKLHKRFEIHLIGGLDVDGGRRRREELVPPVAGCDGGEGGEEVWMLWERVLAAVSELHSTGTHEK